MSNVSSKPAPSFPRRGLQVAWGPVAAVVVTVLALFGVQFFIAFVLSALFALFGLDQLWSNSTFSQFYFVVLCDAGILLAIWYFLQSRGAGFKQLGLARSPAWRDLSYALIGYASYFVMFLVVSILASALTPINLDQKQELGFDYLSGSVDKLIALLSLVILPPIVEEIVFRGFLFTGLRKKLSFVWTTLITSVIFAALHLLQSSDGLLWVAGLDTLFLSFVLCYLREKTGALWAPMLVHLFKNAVAFTYLLSQMSH